MTTPWRKAIRELWLEKPRTLLVVLAIALGITCFTAVLSAYGVLTRELEREYLATNPASATIWTDRVDVDLLRAIEADSGVSEVEARRTVSGRIKSGPVDWRPLMLFVVDDFANIRVSTINPQDGSWPPEKGEILIERDALQVARAGIGDTVTVKLSDGNERALLLIGSAHDIGQAQARMENVVYGYISRNTLGQLGLEPYLDELKILASGDRFDQGHVDEVATRVAKLVEAGGHSVRRMEVPEAGKHPHAALMATLLLVMSSFGFLVLVLSGTLVVNLLTALMASQVRQIGTMKTVGGSRLQIAAIYFAQSLWLGAAATVLAVPTGVLGGRVLGRTMASFMNFDIDSFAVPVWVMLIVFAVGFAVPLLASAWPIWKTSRISIREAMNDYGLSGDDFGRNGLDRALSRFDSGYRPILFALRNSWRHRGRLMLTVTTLTLGGLFFISALNVRASLINTIDTLFAARKYDLSLRLQAMVSTAALEESAEKIPGVIRAEGWIVTTATFPASEPAPVKRAGAASHGSAPNHGSKSGEGSGRDRFALVGLPPDSELMELNIVKGRGLAADDVDAIVVNTALSDRSPWVRLGQTVEFATGPVVSTWHVVGIAKEPFLPATGYVPLRFFEERSDHPGMTNSLRVGLERSDPESIARVRNALEGSLGGSGIVPLLSRTTAEIRYGFDQHMLMIYVFLIVMACLIGGVGVLGLMTTMSITVLERRREIGVLRAIGATPSMVMLIVVMEGAAIGLLSWMIATAASWPISRGLTDFLVNLMFKSPPDFRFQFVGLVGWLVVSVAVAALASLIPAWHASRSQVREALDYE